jgi:hypothetical protein
VEELRKRLAREQAEAEKSRKEAEELAKKQGKEKNKS